MLWIEDVRTALGEVDIAQGGLVCSADVRSLENGKRVAFDTPFWFAVAAFDPDVRIVER